MTISRTIAAFATSTSTNEIVYGMLLSYIYVRYCGYVYVCYVCYAKMFCCMLKLNAF